MCPHCIGMALAAAVVAVPMAPTVFRFVKSTVKRDKK